MISRPSYSIAISILILMIIAGCKKDDPPYIPDIKLISKQSEGLTTDNFSFKITFQEELPQDEKIHCRWDWNADSIFDTMFSNDLEREHRFYKPGKYLVICESLSLSGGKALDTISILVNQGHSAPKPAFEVFPETGHYLTTFQFDASKTYDDEDSLETLKFRWDFENDGLWDTPFLDEPSIVHLFKGIKENNVNLEVMDPGKRSASALYIVITHQTDTCIVPEFEWFSESGRAGDIFVFNASMSHHQDHPSMQFKYKWYFPGREYINDSISAVIEHKFLYPGPKKVKLIIEDENMLQNSLEKELFVSEENAPPRPVIVTPSKFGNIETLFYLNAWQSIDDHTPTSQLLLRWDFDGDGLWDTQKSYDKELHHQFVEEGKYTCILEAEDEEGLVSTTRTEFWVSPHNNPTSYLYDKRDGKYYGSVKIGNQWWMSDNLDYRDQEKMNIPMFQKCYDEDDGMCDQFGSLYQAGRCISYIEEGNRLCPEGWRLPTSLDLIELASNIPSQDTRASLMVGGNTGFNAIYSGFGSYSFVYDLATGTIIEDTLYFFERHEEEVRYMSLTQRNSTPERSQYVYGVQRNYDGFNRMWGSKDKYFPIRCIKEE